MVNRFLKSVIDKEYPDLPDWVNREGFVKYMIREIEDILWESLREDDKTLFLDCIALPGLKAKFVGEIEMPIDSKEVKIPNEIKEFYKENMDELETSLDCYSPY